MTVRIRSAVVPLALLAACSSGSGTERAADGRDPTTAPVHFEGGVAKVSVPLSARQLPVTAIVGRYVVVFGGYRVGATDFEHGTTRVTPFDDGAVFDTEARTWRALPPSPFPAAPYLPAVVSAPDAMVVIGLPCAHAADDDDGEDATCPRGAVPQVASYSPSRNTWTSARRLQVPAAAEPIVDRARRYGTALIASGLGWVRGGAVIRLNELGRPLLHVGGDGPATAIDGAGVSGDDCVIADELFSFGLDERFGAAAEEPNPTRGAVWDGRGYNPIASVATPTRLWQNGVHCASGAAAYLSVFGNFAGPGRDLWWFDPGTRTWSAMTNPVPAPPLSGFSPMNFMGRRMFQTDAHLYLQDGDGWREHGLWTQTVRPAERYLVRGPDDPSDHLMLTVVDPAQMFPGVFPTA